MEEKPKRKGSQEDERGNPGSKEELKKPAK